jgi:hypothetical protein
VTTLSGHLNIGQTYKQQRELRSKCSEIEKAGGGGEEELSEKLFCVVKTILSYLCLFFSTKMFQMCAVSLRHPINNNKVR